MVRESKAFCTCEIVFWICPTASAVLVAKDPISDATTANPLPASPARAASIDAFKDKRLICSAISEMTFAISSILLTTFAFSILSARRSSNCFANVLADSKDLRLVSPTSLARPRISCAIAVLFCVSSAKRLTLESTSSVEALTSSVAALVVIIALLTSSIFFLISAKFSDNSVVALRNFVLASSISVACSAILLITSLLLSYMAFKEPPMTPSSSWVFTCIGSTVKSPSAKDPAKALTRFSPLEMELTLKIITRATTIRATIQIPNSFAKSCMIGWVSSEFGIVIISIHPVASTRE